MRSTEPNVSLLDIVVPTTLTRTDLLRKSVNSILRQTDLSNVSIHLFINGTNEEEVDNIRSYFPSLKIRYSDTKLTIAESWLRASSCGHGKYFMLMHDDDLLSEKFVDSFKRFVEANEECVLIHTGAKIIDSRDSELRTTNLTYPRVMTGDDFFRHHLEGEISFICPSVIYNRTLVPNHLEWNKNLPFTLDVEYFLRCTRYGKIGFINQSIFKYRIHQGSTSSKFKKNYKLKLKDRKHHRIFLKKEIKDRLGEYYLYLADRYYYSALSVDLWFFRLTNSRVEILSSLNIIRCLITFEWKVLKTSFFWKFLFRMFLPQILINAVRTKRTRI
ncbi:glycosyltransferase family 2 protein [Schleiferiaceae bacterium]|nr:glycosyltransferase family 2 protein [Schleiferiaceae bacterium]